MFDIEISMDNTPGTLARFGEAVGAAGHSIEGGGMWTVNGVGVAHFLFADGPGVTAVLERAGFQVVGCRPVVVQRLKQDVPGQLGQLCRLMADAGANIEVLYSDHDHQLIIGVDPDTLTAAQAVSRTWAAAG